MRKTWPTKKLGEVGEFISGGQNINKGKAIPDGKYPAFSASEQDIFLDTYQHKWPAIIFSWIGARCGKCFLANGN
jgi:type I restriction enzyme S subunit